MNTDEYNDESTAHLSKTFEHNVNITKYKYV
jgi:hypothetical protein